MKSRLLKKLKKLMPDAIPFSHPRDAGKKSSAVKYHDGVFRVCLGAPLQKKRFLLCESMSKSISLRPENPVYFASCRRRAHVVDGRRREEEKREGAFGSLREVPDLRRLGRRGTLGPREGNLLGRVLTLHVEQPLAIGSWPRAHRAGQALCSTRVSPGWSPSQAPCAPGRMSPARSGAAIVTPCRFRRRTTRRTTAPWLSSEVLSVATLLVGSCLCTCNFARDGAVLCCVSGALSSANVDAKGQANLRTSLNQ